MKLKKKLLGVNARVLEIPNTIQPQEYSRSSGTDGVYTFSAEPERQSERVVPVFQRLRVELELQLAQQSVECRQSIGFARHSLLSLLVVGRVLFYNLSAPTTQHPADFCQRYRQRGIFFVVQCLCFPEYHQQDIERVQFLNRSPQVWQLLSAGKKASGILGLNADYINQYVKYMADRRLEELGFAPHYSVSNPAKWMATANDVHQLVNFFEATNTAYEVDAKAHNAKAHNKEE